MSSQEQSETSKRALEKVIQDSNELLVKATTVLSPQKVTLLLNRTKLVAETRSAFGAVTVASLRVEDVVNANATIGPFFGTVRITTKLSGPKALLSFGLFKRKDTLNLKRVIQGYIIAREKGIDLDAISVAELTSLLYELGEDDHSVQ